jgi:hypothetical protein
MRQLVTPGVSVATGVRVLQQQKRPTKRPTKAVAAEEADEVTVLGRTFPMSSGVSN